MRKWRHVLVQRIAQRIYFLVSQLTVLKHTFLYRLGFCAASTYAVLTGTLRSKHLESFVREVDVSAVSIG